MDPFIPCGGHEDVTSNHLWTCEPTTGQVIDCLTLTTLETETVYLRILSMMLVLRNVAAILGAFSLFLEKGIPTSTFHLLSGP